MGRANGYRNEAIDWARQRGWRYAVLAGGHIRLTHHHIPSTECVTTSATAGDYRAEKNCKAEVKRLEAKYGIFHDVGRGNKIEPFLVRQLDDGQLEYATKCRECSTEGTCYTRSGAARIGNAVVRKRLQSKGWYIGQKRKTDCCPDCQVVEIKPADANGSASKAVAPVEAREAPAQSQDGKVSGEARIDEIVHFTGHAAEMLDRLVASGLYGSDRSSAIETLTLQALRSIKKASS